jgi:molecular chaperone DnaJ
MRLRGKGIQRLGAYGVGDLLLTIHVETPTKLSSHQRELLEQLGSLEDEGASNPMSKGFFDKVRDLFH